MEDGCEHMDGRAKVLISLFYKVGEQEILLKFEGVRNTDYL